MKKLIYIILAILVVVVPMVCYKYSSVFASLNSTAVQMVYSKNKMPISTCASGACVYSANRILAGQNENKKLAMASTTKVLTCITAITYGKDLDEVFEIDPSAVGVSGTSLYLRKGDRYSLRSLLYGLMLVSGNDASVAIACEVGKRNLLPYENITPYEKFMYLMNNLAVQMGATCSHFDNPHGLDSPSHYTTALDLAKIAYKALDNATFREIVSTKNTKITSADGKISYLKNKNKLLSLLDGCVGVKTGYTSKAGRCLVSAVENKNGRFVCVVLSCRPMFEESSVMLADASGGNYKTYHLADFVDLPTSIVTQNAKEPVADINCTEDFEICLSSTEKDKIKVCQDILPYVSGSSKAGKKVGQIDILIGGDSIFKTEIVLAKDVLPPTIWQRAKDIINKF